MASQTLEKNVLLDMKPDVESVSPGYSLDMLRDLLTIAEYTSLHFTLKPENVNVVNGVTYVTAQAYKAWAARGF